MTIRKTSTLGTSTCDGPIHAIKPVSIVDLNSAVNGLRS
jgi:hypothetical protein